MSRIFPAQYDGWCPECADRIEVGDYIGYDDYHQVVHEECLPTPVRNPKVLSFGKEIAADHQDSSTKAVTVCPVCHMTICDGHEP